MTKKLLPQKIVNELGLIITDKTVGDSQLYGCVFYLFKGTDIYITNYNINNIEGPSDLSTKGVWLMFCVTENVYFNQMVSNEILEDAGIMGIVLIEFTKTIHNKLNKK